MYYVISKKSNGVREYLKGGGETRTNGYIAFFTTDLADAKKFSSYAQAAHYKNDNRPKGGWGGWRIICDDDAAIETQEASNKAEYTGSSTITAPAKNAAKAKKLLLKENAVTVLPYRDGSASIFFNLVGNKTVRVALSSVDVSLLLDKLKPIQ